MFHKLDFQENRSVDPEKYIFSLNGTVLFSKTQSCSVFDGLDLFDVNCWDSHHRKKRHKFGREKEAWWRVYPSSANLSARETKTLQSICRNSRFIPQGLYHSISTRFCSGDSARLFRTTTDRVQVQTLGLHGGSLQWPCSHWRHN